MSVGRKIRKRLLVDGVEKKEVVKKQYTLTVGAKIVDRKDDHEPEVGVSEGMKRAVRKGGGLVGGGPAMMPMSSSRPDHRRAAAKASSTSMGTGGSEGGRPGGRYTRTTRYGGPALYHRSFGPKGGDRRHPPSPLYCWQLNRSLEKPILTPWK